ncbi:MAG: hypothetical protein AB7V55_01920 [Oscillospiraceae bacterium]
MTEWQVVGVIITLLGFAITVAGPILKLNASITTLTVTMKLFTEKLQKMDTENDASHRRMWRKHNGQDEKIANHDKRIHLLEGGKPRH